MCLICSVSICLSIYLNERIEVINETFLFFVIELWVFHLTNRRVKVRDRRGEACILL